MEDLATDNSAAVVADNPHGEPSAQINGTGTTNGQATGAAPGDDLFKGVDPNKLPPEVKAHYDSMLRDYREKTTKLSETTKSEVAKATEAYRQKAEFYDQFAGQEEFVKQWNEHVQRAQAQNVQNGQPADQGLSKVEAKLQEITQELQAAKMEKVTDAFAEAVNEKGEKLHPEFDQLNSIYIGKLQQGDQAEDFSLLRACIELSQSQDPQQRLVEGHKTAKAVYDQIFEEGKKAGMGRLQAKAQNGSLPPTNANTDGLTVTEKRPKSAREALDMARKQIVVSR